MAQEGASNGFYDFMYGKFLLSDFFDIHMQEDDYVERAYNVWRDIGNIATAVHAFEFTVDASGSVKLPCNMEFVEAVTAGNGWRDELGDSVILYQADWNTNSNQNLADAISSPNSNKISLSTETTLHPKGEFIPYELHGTIGSYTLGFAKEFVGTSGVCIYRGTCVDKDGNPLLTRKETEAIAHKLAFIHLRKRIFMGDVAAAGIMQQTRLEQEYGRKMAAAKIPEYVPQNQWDRMFSAMTSHNRKVHWSSYKSVQ